MSDQVLVMVTDTALISAAGNNGEGYKVNDLNVQADATAEDEDDDDVEWEEG